MRFAFQFHGVIVGQKKDFEVSPRRAFSADRIYYRELQEKHIIYMVIIEHILKWYAIIKYAKLSLLALLIINKKLIIVGSYNCYS